MEVKEKEEENELVVNDGVINENDSSVGDTTDLVDNSTEKSDNEGTDEKKEEKEVRTYSEEDVQKMIQARTDSLNRKHQKELKKYREAEDILKQGLDVDNIDDINKQLRSFYKDQGVEIKESQRDDKEEKILAKADVDEIISFGDEEIQNTALELYNKPKRTVREEAVLNGLMQEISLRNATNELKKIGADEKITNSNEFKTFASKFNRNVPITEIYEIYSKNNKPSKKQPPSAGSMKTNSNEPEIKDFYTPQEAAKFTREQIQKNPKLGQVIRESMLKWNKQ